MEAIAHGIDIVEVGRIASMVERHGERFIERCFTRAEAATARALRRSAEHLAGRFAAKEAVLKAIGTGWRDGIAWTDIEVSQRPTGEPVCRVSGRAGEIARERGIDRWLISISHTGGLAVASVIALGPTPPPR